MATKPSSTDSHEVSPIPPPRVRPLVIAGPSGSGKSTLLRKLFKEFPDTFGLSVSHTTRRPRAGEVNGKEYYFTTREEMKKSIEKGEFLEWTEFSGNMYGTSKQAIKDVLAANRVCVLDIDMVGVKNMKETDLNPVYVLIKPPSLEELEKRLRDRGSETEESLKRRLDTAKGELEFAQTPGVFNHVVVNGISVDEAYQQLKTIIHKDLVPTKDESSK